RGYAEDSHPEKLEPGTIFDLTVPIWRVAEGLLHAARAAVAFNVSEPTIEFEVRYTGIAGRRLKAWSSSEYWGSEHGTARADEGVSRAVFSVAELESLLPECVQRLLGQIFYLFQFADVPLEVYAGEIKKMKERRW
ncbi:MAG: hypothetical protein U0136_22265, partial [Bdellovibrionota bacterium]